MRTMGWLFMLACGAAVGMLFGTSPQIAFYLAFVVLAVNFATFCLLYDEPFKRARNRNEQQLLQISSKGAHAEEYQRLQSRKIVATAEDHRFTLTPMSGVNMLSGFVGVGLLCWGVIARIVN